MKKQDESRESAERYRASYAVPHGFRQARHEPPIKFQCARPKNDHSNKAGEVCKYLKCSCTLLVVNPLSREFLC